MRQISCSAQGDVLTIRGGQGFPLIARGALQDPHDPIITKLIDTVMEGLRYYPPELCEEGVNGTYFLNNKEGKRVAVFKPIDEEGSLDNNPKKSEDDQFVNMGLLAGELALREVAAYLLDKDHFSGVPRTAMVNLAHSSFRSSKGMKIGSLQEYIDNEGSADDRGPKQFRVRDVHKIGVLDLRIFNNDRHGGNILLVETAGGNGYRLVPIDQGLSLSSTLNCAIFEWLNWPQAKVPFDDETRRYIQRINVEENAQTLAKLGIRPECIRTMKISSTLLKKGAAAGLTLYEIGSMAARTVPEQPCTLEILYDQAVKEANGDEKHLLRTLCKLLDAEIANKIEQQCPSPRLAESWRNHVATKSAV